MDNVGDAKQQFKIFFPFPGITDEASPIRLHALFSANVETKTSDNQGLLFYCIVVIDWFVIAYPLAWPCLTSPVKPIVAVSDRY